MEDIWLDSKFKEKKRNIKRRNNEKKKVFRTQGGHM